MKTKNILLCFVFLLVVNGCAKWQGALGMDADLPTTCFNAVDQLLQEARQPINTDTTFLVASLVNINSLDHSSTLGRMLSCCLFHRTLSTLKYGIF